jgi:hypothetical protein
MGAPGSPEGLCTFLAERLHSRPSPSTAAARGALSHKTHLLPRSCAAPGSPLWPPTPGWPTARSRPSDGADGAAIQCPWLSVDFSTKFPDQAAVSRPAVAVDLRDVGQCLSIAGSNRGRALVFPMLFVHGYNLPGQFRGQRAREISQAARQPALKRWAIARTRKLLHQRKVAAPVVGDEHRRFGVFE